MSRVSYKDIPIEIKNRIKELSRHYDEEVIGAHYDTSDALPPFSSFRYTSSPEGFDFWEKVMNEQKFDVFFEKYPKKAWQQHYFKAPKNIQKNSKLEVVYNCYFSGEDRSDFLEEMELTIGSIVILHKDDGSDMPEFRLPNDKLMYLSWSYLKPIETKSTMSSDKCFKDEARPNEKVGSKYKFVQGMSSYFNVGDIVTLIINDGSPNPKFRNPETGKELWVSWCELTDIDNQVVSSDFSNEPQPYEVIGTEYECVNHDIEDDCYTTGDIVKYYYNDNSRCPKFLNKRTGETVYVFWKHLKRIVTPESLTTVKKYRFKTKEEFGGRTPGSWVRNMEKYCGQELAESDVKRYEKALRDDKDSFTGGDKDWTFNITDVIETNLNLNTQHNGKESHTYEPILFRISSTVTYGAAPRGIAISCARSKIQLGS